MKKKRGRPGTSKAEAAQKRALFVEAYCANGGNATQAVKTAGYVLSGPSARVKGSVLLKEPDVAAAIKERMDAELAKAQENTGLTVEGTLRELHSMVHSDLRKAFDPKTGALLPPHLWPDDVARGMASVKVVEMAGGMKVDGEHVPMYTKEVKLWDKNSAVEKAMKKFGLLIDRKEIGEPGAFERLDDDELTRAAIEADRVIAAAKSQAGNDRKVGDRRRNKSSRSAA